MNWYKISQAGFLPGIDWQSNYPTVKKSKTLLEEIKSLMPQIISSAQEIYDDWEQNDQGEDSQYGCGGICDSISKAISDVVNSNIRDVEIFDGGQDGDDHAFIIVKKDNEAYAIDIPPGFYESGGGYCWVKKRGVTFTPEMVDIYKVHAEDLENQT